MAMRKIITIRKSGDHPSPSSARRNDAIGSVTRKCSGVVSELDPLMHILLYRLTLGRMGGPLMSKDMLVCIGFMALMLLEELI